MIRSFLLITCLFATLHSFSQTVTDSVKTVVDRLFTAMKNSDSAMINSCFGSDAILQTIAKNKEGKVSIKNEHVSGFAKQIASLPKGNADERIRYDMVRVDADLAIVWTPYQFYYKGNFSHCGVNSFQLVRLNGEWKIQYLIDTRRKDNCL